MAKAGAKGKYTAEIVKTITDLIKGGCFVKNACEVAEISQETYYQWLKKPEFSEAVKKAEAERKAGLIIKIRKDSSWQSAAWMLERLYREDFAPPVRHEITGKDGEPFTIQVVHEYLHTPKLDGSLPAPDRGLKGSAQV